MINVTRKYIEACDSPNRSSYVVAKYGLFNKEAKLLINSVEVDKQNFSSASQTYDEVKSKNYNYITCEPNKVILNNTFAFIDDKNKVNESQNVGLWSKQLSDENGNFSPSFNIVYTFRNNVNYTPLTLTFDEVVSDLTIEYYLNDLIVKTKTITGNDELVVLTENDVSNQLAFWFNKLKISILKTKKAYRFAKLLEIDFGLYETFKKEEINSLEIIEEISLDSSKSISNSCSISINDKNGDYDIINPYNKLETLQEKGEITVYHYIKVGNIFKEVSLGTFLIKGIKYQEKKLKIECYDDRYFMNQTYYGSKFYKNEKLGNVLSDLFSYFNYGIDKYVIDSDIEGELITGYIPIVSFSEALRLICESVCAIVKKTRDGITRICKSPISADTSVENQPVVKLFKIRNYDKSNPTKNVYNSVLDINEYIYNKSSEKKSLYNGSLKKGVHIIQFENYPICYGDYVDNVNSLKVGEGNNYTITKLYASACEVEVSVDDTKVELSGYVYEQSINAKRVSKGDVKNTSSNEYSVGKVENNLINSSNSQKIALWKLNRGNIIYSFDTNSVPYIETGDLCKIELPYKTIRPINDQYIKRFFTPTKLNFNLGIKETIEGE